MENKDKYSDTKTLIKDLKSGDVAAFCYIYDNYFSQLTKYSIRILHTDLHSHDIVQDAFIKLWQNRNKFTISPIAYLYRSVYNASIDHYDHKKVVEKYEKLQLERVYYDKVVQHPDAELLLVDKDLVKLFEEAKKRLPERCRLIFEMSRNKHLKNREISEILGISEKCVENQMTIAIARLYKDLNKVIENKNLFIFLFGG